ncbi:glycine-N-acyltransferase-like protein 3 [Spea bombifrons]|uniref:glycine-N-acyltransferase-like protein 3 n=1 Tax=Spea bombifrons TaxID=233779 RepID=UPI00234B9D40|nr:glycine-N-acyltransferase-like protein 3 [Spea bombifrons]
MMRSIREADELEHLQELLRTHLPESLKIYGSLFSVLNGNPFGVEVLVDSWPNFGVVMTRPLTVPSAWDPFTNSYSFFMRDASKVSAVMEHIEWTRPFEVQTMQDSFATDLTKEASRRDVTIQTSLLRTYWQEKQDEANERNLKSQVTPEISCLSPANAPLVDASWSFGGSTSSLRYVSLCLGSLPSSCAVDSEGNPVSWVLCDHYCAMRVLYTVPNHRRFGLGSKVALSLAKTLMMQGRPAYCHVEEENIASQLMFKSLGLEETSSRLLWVKSIVSMETDEASRLGH